MKRHALIKHLKAHGCILHREGRRHSVFIQPDHKKSSTVPRHREIDDKIARKICRDLGIDEIGK